MKHTLRLLLPPLRVLTLETVLPFALIDRDLRVLRQGALPLRELAAACPARVVQAIVHADDVVQVCVPVPPLTGAKLQAAVQSIIEPLALSSPEQLAWAHGPRQPDGQAMVVWTDREVFAQAWHAFAQAGLDRVRFYPVTQVMPLDARRVEDDAQPAQAHARTADGVEALASPAPGQTTWLTLPVPDWSLNPPALRPAPGRASPWRAPLLWSGAAAVIWVVGLNLHANRVAQESEALRAGMQRQVAQAFPDIAVVLDPLKQATQKRDALRVSHGSSGDDTFMTLALAGAQLLPQARNRVQTVRYEKGVLTLGLEEDESTAAPDARPIEQAAVRGLTLARTDGGWRLQRQTPGTESGRAGDAPTRLRFKQVTP